MRVFSLFDEGDGNFAWELKTREINALGDVRPDGRFIITRVVHKEATTCLKATVKAMDVDGRAHLGYCS